MHPSINSLDALLIESWPLIRSGDSLVAESATLADELEKILAHARQLNAGFKNWADNQPEEWRPSRVGLITRRCCAAPQNLSWISGPIYEYLDRKRPLASK